MTTFEVWAPAAERVEVEVGPPDGAVRHAMAPVPDRAGWWRADVAAAGHGTDYGFRVDGSGTGLPDDGPLPDPRSRRQPYGVLGRSRVYEHDRFAWHDDDWRGRPLSGAVLYELHVGTFTPAGTFDAAIERLGHLVELGVDMVEVLPVAAFPGRHGWGYDGVHLWSVHAPYGGPDGLKRFVDACHGHGLGVVLDVVYNHVGPTGNFLGRYGPYFNDAHPTPWGQGVNVDRLGSDEVRAFVVDNALMWLRDYHIDGLRLDAVHAIADFRAVHLLEELAREVGAAAAHLGRRPFLIAESDLNDPRLITPSEAGGYGLDAQWSDDFHHALHAALTGERQAYYCDFGSMAALAKTLTEVFFHNGTYSTFRGRGHGRPVDVARVPAHRFVGYLQNHDQIGNRAVGDRISATLSPSSLKVGAGLLLTSPFTPMLFMGEEWGAGTPWCFFTDHVDPEQARNVSAGRREEFAGHGWTETADPQDPETYRGSILDWAEPGKPRHRELLEWYRALIALRRAHPELTDPRLTETRADYDEDGRWLVLTRGRLRVAANLGARPVRLPERLVGPGGAEPLLTSHPSVRPPDLPAESLAVWAER
ncbi:MAG TPA: malto-oligosyltrehalose trehalohydrolase [Streptosporangiaceae bacterium]|nr:malto-oligosyltrehalose trehalohydrolase [Streptosporangiaceae bacterium]